MVFPAVTVNDNELIGFFKKMENQLQRFSDKVGAAVVKTFPAMAKKVYKNALPIVPVGGSGELKKQMFWGAHETGFYLGSTAQNIKGDTYFKYQDKIGGYKPHFILKKYIFGSENQKGYVWVSKYTNITVPALIKSGREIGNIVGFAMLKLAKEVFTP